MKARLALEKRCKHNRVPVHHQAIEYIEAYLQKSGMAQARDTPPSPVHPPRHGIERSRAAPRKRMPHDTAAHEDAGIGCHSFRGTGTNFLEHGGTLETAARIADHASTKTTQLYDRRNSGIDQGEIERIRF